MHSRFRTYGLVLVGAVAGALVCHFFELRLRGLTVDWPTSITSGKDLVEAAAVLVGGFWTYRLFVRQRLDYTRANIAHSVKAIQLDEKTRLIRVIVTVENVGTVAIRPPEAVVILYRIAPIDPAELVLKLEAGDSVAPTPEDNWPEIARCDLPVAGDGVVLEPGETENFPCDFLIPSTISAVQLHSEIKCGAGSKAEYWDETTLHDLSPIAA